MDTSISSDGTETPSTDVNNDEVHTMKLLGRIEKGIPSITSSSV